MSPGENRTDNISILLGIPSLQIFQPTAFEPELFRLDRLHINGVATDGRNQG